MATIQEKAQKRKFNLLWEEIVKDAAEIVEIKRQQALYPCSFPECRGVVGTDVGSYLICNDCGGI